MSRSPIALPDWTARAEPAPHVHVDVGFHVVDDLYYGPENDFTEEQWESLRAPLYRPDLPIRDGFALVADAAEAPDELVRYYADVVRLLGEHGKPPARSPHLFWIRPFVLVGGETVVNFPWSDAWDDTEQVLDALEVAEPGVVFWDRDQGWEVEVAVSESRLFVRHSDPDAGEEWLCVSFDRADVARQARRLRAQCRAILGRLRSEVGPDYWTRPPVALAPRTGIQPWHLAALLALATVSLLPLCGLTLMYNEVLPALAVGVLYPATVGLVLVRPWIGAVAAAIVSAVTALVIVSVLAWVGVTTGTSLIDILANPFMPWFAYAPLMATTLATWGALRLRRAILQHIRFA